MDRQGPALLAVMLAGTLLTAACTDDDAAPVTVQPGAPGQPGREVTDRPAVAEHPHTAADISFLHAMIEHHEQALRMTRLVPDRTTHDEIRLLAGRMEISQAAELTRMRDWLAARGEPTRGPHPHGSGAPAPGMLTEDQLAELTGATGAEFDRRFLELMIHHHEGALIMVAELRANGGGQPAEVDQLATHLEVDQRIEIDRMEDLLTVLAPP